MVATRRLAVLDELTRDFVHRVGPELLEKALPPKVGRVEGSLQAVYVMGCCGRRLAGLEHARLLVVARLCVYVQAFARV